VGTPGYLSPEVCLGNPVDARSDLFALGIVLYEMLSGQIPFNDPSPLKLMLSVVESEVPDILKLNQSIDQDTVSLLHKLLAKNPDDRYQSADLLLAALAKHPDTFDPSLSVHARLPTGAASTLLATPGLAKAAARSASTKAKQLDNTSDTKNNSPRVLWSSLALVALTAIGSLLWFNRAPTIPPSVAEPKAKPTEQPGIAASRPEPTTVTPTIKPPIAEPLAETKLARTVVEDTVAIAAKPEKSLPLATKTEATGDVKTTAKASNLAPAQAMQKYGEVYLGPQNEEVSVAQVVDEDIAYIKVIGINSPYDGKVIRTVPRPAPFDGKDYAIEHNGRDYVVLVMRNHQTSVKYIALFLPGLKDEIKLTFDGALSKQLNTDALRDEFLNQKK
jgi:hypothetical protein